LFARIDGTTGLAVAAKTNPASNGPADEENASDRDDQAKTTEDESEEGRRARRRRSQLRDADDERGDERRETDDGEQQSERQTNRPFGADAHFNSLDTMSITSKTPTNHARPERRHSAGPRRART